VARKQSKYFFKKSCDVYDKQGDAFQQTAPKSNLGNLDDTETW